MDKMIACQFGCVRVGLYDRVPVRLHAPWTVYSMAKNDSVQVWLRARWAVYTEYTVQRACRQTGML